jgi:predicted Zn-dependent protease
MKTETDSMFPRLMTSACLAHSCHCHAAFNPGRRLFGTSLVAIGAAAALPVWGREGVDVGNKSWAAGLVPAQEIEQAAQQQYGQMLKQASAQNALGSASNAQVVRLRAIAARLIPFSYQWNERGRQWKWEVNLIGSKQINAFCMPGGKIAFYSGILEQLKLTDDEVATVMGHEVAHALREHARARVGKSAATQGAIELGAALLGLGSGGRLVADMGGKLLNLRFGREDESEADLIGMELAARAGYDPRAGVTLWQKMAVANKGAPPQWLSTHPAGSTRIADIEAGLPQVLPLYQKAPKPGQRFDSAS